MTSRSADKKLLLFILLLLLLFVTAVILVLFFLVKTKLFIILASALSVLFLVLALWLILYFRSVKYEKGESFIKITSGIVVRKITFISTETSPVVIRYTLPLDTGFAVVYIYGGAQLILSTKVI